MSGSFPSLLRSPLMVDQKRIKPRLFLIYSCLSPFQPTPEGDFIFIRRASVLLLLLLFTGCVHTVPLKDAAGHIIPGSIARMETAIIGGIPQSIWFRGVSVSNPALILLHGGP